MKIRCPFCGRLVRVKIPKGGDGSAVRPHRHGADGETCMGSYSTLDVEDTVED